MIYPSVSNKIFKLYNELIIIIFIKKTRSRKPSTFELNDLIPIKFFGDRLFKNITLGNSLTSEQKMIIFYCLDRVY